jgi:YbbR domain-containing protein
MEKKRKKIIFIRICCVFASFCLWLYISNWENPIRTDTIKNIPVKLVNTDSLVQDNLILTPNQEFFTNLSVRGTDLDLSRIKASDFNVIADMSLYVLRKGDNKIPVEISSFPNNVNIENTNNMYVDVQLDDILNKTVPIKIKYENASKKEYDNFDETTIPSEAIVTGPSKLVSNVTKVLAVVNFVNSKPSIQYEATDSDSKVISGVKTENIIEKTFTVNINAVNLGSGFNVNFDTNVEKVTVTGDESIINTIKDGDIKCTVDCNSLTQGTYNLKVQTDVPSGLSNVALSQNIVKANIVKK